MSLEYRSSNGTRLKVGLIPDSVFMGGGEETTGGRYFNPNIPSEEIFISPKAGEAEGIVYSTKPLSYQGELIETSPCALKAAGPSKSRRRRTSTSLKR